MEPEKKTLQCPICQAAYSRKDNLPQHLIKFHSENIATRIIIIIIIYLTYYMFLQEKLKSIKLTKLINILLHNEKNCYTWVTFLLTMVPPVQVAFLDKAYESCRLLPL